MQATNVDLVFVVDASSSMKPCFDALRTHLREVIAPLQGHAAKVRFGLVSMYTSRGEGGEPVYNVGFLCGSGLEAIEKLYERGPNDPDPRNDFFTEDPKLLNDALSSIKAKGNEEMLVALDIAADLPFGPLSNTKRVIALFSDERFEDGVVESENIRMIPALIDKIHARHIHLFAYVPDGNGIQTLSSADRSEITLIEKGRLGLAGMDFRKLLGDMGRSISVSSLQAVSEPPYQRALFGQDTWIEGHGVPTGQ